MTVVEVAGMGEPIEQTELGEADGGLIRLLAGLLGEAAGVCCTVVRGNASATAET